MSNKRAILSCAAYETAIKIIVESAVQCRKDTLTSVFSSIIAGKLPAIGTGRVMVDYDNSESA